MRDDTPRKVREALQDACGAVPSDEYDEMVWDGDMLVPAPRRSPLDAETLDERYAKQMGPRYEQRRRDDE